VNQVFHFLFLRKMFFLILTLFLFLADAQPQVIREYTVKKTYGALEIDGQLSETEWQAAALTEPFLIYQDGSTTRLNTQAKFLWDEQYLYIGFICEDPDVWATMVNRDDYLWNGEVVEILCDPDGDGLNYFEVQVNPLQTILDLFLAKPYYQGGSADIGWNLDSIKAAVFVDGTLNDSSDTDVQWFCEVALPFQELAFMAPTINFPPQDKDAWRILVTRYDYERGGDEIMEVSSWNQTDSRGFHVPSKFGRIIFSTENVLSIGNNDDPSNGVRSFRLLSSYPNPFNPVTTIRFAVPHPGHVSLIVYDLNGKEIKRLIDDIRQPGYHRVVFDGSSCSSGVYLCVMRSDNVIKTNKMILIK